MSAKKAPFFTLFFSFLPKAPFITSTVMNAKIPIYRHSKQNRVNLSYITLSGKKEKENPYYRDLTSLSYSFTSLSSI